MCYNRVLRRTLRRSNPESARGVEPMAFPARWSAVVPVVERSRLECEWGPAASRCPYVIHVHTHSMQLSNFASCTVLADQLARVRVAAGCVSCRKCRLLHSASNAVPDVLGPYVTITSEFQVSCLRATVRIAAVLQGQSCAHLSGSSEQGPAGLTAAPSDHWLVPSQHRRLQRRSDSCMAMCGGQ